MSSNADAAARRFAPPDRLAHASSTSSASTPILEALSRELDEAADDVRARLAAQLAPYIAPSAPELLDATAAARRLGLNPDTVVRMAREGRLPAVKAGRAWRFSADMLVVDPPAAHPPFSPAAPRGDGMRRERTGDAIRRAPKRCA